MDQEKRAGLPDVDFMAIKPSRQEAKSLTDEEYNRLCQLVDESPYFQNALDARVSELMVLQQKVVDGRKGR